LTIDVIVGHFCSVHHHSWVAPVEFLASDGKGSPHALEDIRHALVHPFNLSLIICLSPFNYSNDTFSICILQRDRREFFLQSEMDVTVLKVVIVDLD